MQQIYTYEQLEHKMIQNSSSKQPRLDLVAQIDGKTEKIEIPQYSLRFPNYDRVSLATVKTGIYHPNLSTIQKDVNENFLSKFPIENSKTSTNLQNDKFAYRDEEKAKVSHPIRLEGDIELSAQRFHKSNVPVLMSEPVPSERLSTKTSCISGKEHLEVNSDQKVKEQFRFNRVRSVPSEHPEHGHRPCYFNTNPGLDKFGLRVEANTSSKFRKNDGFKHTNLSIKDGFKPYGYTLKRV